MHNKYEINLWDDDPTSGADACSTGFEFETETEARAFFGAADPIAMLAARREAEVDSKLARGAADCRMPVAKFMHYWGKTPWLELLGPDVHETRKLRDPQPEEPDTEWQHEVAMQQGMAFGCQGFNEAMGYE